MNLQQNIASTRYTESWEHRRLPAPQARFDLKSPIAVPQASLPLLLISF